MGFVVGLYVNTCINVHVSLSVIDFWVSAYMRSGILYLNAAVQQQDLQGVHIEHLHN